MSDKKYWIKEGNPVRHKHWPSFKMIVENVKKKVKEIPENTSDNGSEIIKINKTFVIGVRCHWITDQGLFQTGLFHTTELEPWPTKKAE